MRTILGLEMHFQVTSVKTKLFCSCSADYRGKPPNTNVCPVCLGMPGALPKPNRAVVEKALMVALAFNMEISPVLSWARKHYFYPDLPKSYQITQYDGKGVMSLARGGRIEVEVGGVKRVFRLRRLNIEEDPARLVHPTGSALTSPYVLVDFNRSGVPLLEIVTEPDFSSEVEVEAFLKKVRSVLEHLNVTDFSLEGALRVDVNISVDGGERVEIKNLNSISDIIQAIRYERERQLDALRKNIPIRRETRHWDPIRRVTFPLRRKEVEEDYRYMPDPNLPPLKITRELLEKLRREMPELPDAKLRRLVEEHGLSPYLANVLVSRRALSSYYERVVELSGVKGDLVASYIVNDLLGWVPEESPEKLWKLVPPDVAAKVIKMLSEGLITIKMAKEIIPDLLSGRDPEAVVTERGWRVVRDVEELRSVVRQVFAENEKAVRDALRNKRAIQHLIGKAMERTGKRADPRVLRAIVEEMLERARAELEEEGPGAS